MTAIARTIAIVLAASITLIGCRASFSRLSRLRGDSGERRLEFISAIYDTSAGYERDFLGDFARRNHAELNCVLSTETVNSQLQIYQNLFERRATHPDLYEIDVIWPAILADNLIDLTPYFRDEIKEFEPEIIQNLTVHGRLVALPMFLDVGILYYRADLLAKYGFRTPPATWEQLDQMASVIQQGERRSGNSSFWGYVWQGGSSEGLTCNAMEWQASAGGPAFLDRDGTIHVRNPQMLSALRRALSWIDRISPPGEPYYRESDAMNVWNAGQAAFMRNWVSSYATIKLAPGLVRTGPLPGGPGGQRGMLGGSAMGISRFSKNRDLAVEALRALASEEGQRRRSAATGTLPTRIALRKSARDMAQTALPGDLSSRVIEGLVSRPSLVTANRYALVSLAYAQAINSALLRQQTPEAAMANLEVALTHLGGTLEPKAIQ